MQQHLNFENRTGVALARTTDPQTSKQAAAGIVEKLGDLEQWAANCVAAAPGKTQRELGAIYCPSDLRRIGRRLSGLVDRGRLRRGDARKCSITGRNANTWWVTR